MDLFSLHKIRAKVKHYGPCNAEEFTASGIGKTLMRRKRAARYAKGIRHAIHKEFTGIDCALSSRLLRLSRVLDRVLSYHERRSSFSKWY